MMKYKIKDKKKIIARLLENKEIGNINVVCLGDNDIEQYIEPLEEVPILAVPLLLNEESIIFIEGIKE